jgi:hypothetical protein
MFTRRFPKAVLGLVVFGLMVCAAAAAADRNPMALRVLSNGTIMVAGSYGPNGFFVTGYSPSGALVTKVAITLPFPPVKMAINPDGMVAVGAINPANNGDIWVMKFAGSSGFPMWLMPATFSGKGPEQLSNVGFDAQGNVFVSGATLGSNKIYDYLTLKLDSTTGVRHWVQEETIPSPTATSLAGANLPTAMSFNPDEDVQVTGKIWDGTDYNFGTVCYDNATGIKEFPTAVYDSGPKSLDVPTAMIVDRFDHIDVTGYSSNGEKSIYATLQYECKTGALRWGPVVFSGPGDSVPTAVALDPQGNVLVTGYSEDIFGGYAFVTQKYHKNTGRVLWTANYHALDSFTSYPVAMAVDEKGDLAVTGMVTRQLNNTNYITMKYDGRTGALLWGPVVFDWGNQTQDVPVAIAADAEGNFVVTGSVESPTGIRTATVKYDGLTGSRLWTR